MSQKFWRLSKLRIKANFFTSLGTACLLLLNSQIHATPTFGLNKKSSQNQSFSESPLEIMKRTEQSLGIPEKLLAAIASVESKHSPWAVNAKRRAKFCSSQKDAAAYIRKLQAQGVKNINIGYMQINLQSHGKRFDSIEEILDPHKNIAYAGRLLKNLYNRFGSWETAVRYYHSGSEHHNVPYLRRVYGMWSKFTGNDSLATLQQVSANSYEQNANQVPQSKLLIKIGMGPGVGINAHFKGGK